MEDRWRDRSAHTLIDAEEHTNWDQRIVVPTKTLDTIFAEAGLSEIDYLNLQLNGAEPEALEGLNTYFDKVKIIRSAGHFHRDGVMQADILQEMLEKRNCRVLRRRNTVLAITPKYRDKFEV